MRDSLAVPARPPRCSPALPAWPARPPSIPQAQRLLRRRRPGPRRLRPRHPRGAALRPRRRARPPRAGADAARRPPRPRRPPPRPRHGPARLLRRTSGPAATLPSRLRAAGWSGTRAAEAIAWGCGWPRLAAGDAARLARAARRTARSCSARTDRAGIGLAVGAPPALPRRRDLGPRRRRLEPGQKRDRASVSGVRASEAVSARVGRCPRRSRARRARSRPPPRARARRARPGCPASPSPVTIAPESPSIRCLSGSTSAIARRNAGRVVGVVEDARDEDHRQEDGVDVGRRGVEVRDRVRERDAERREADHAERDEHERARPSRCGQSSPKTTRAGDGDERRPAARCW